MVREMERSSEHRSTKQRRLAPLRFRARTQLTLPALLLLVTACGDPGEADPAPPCEQECQDANALRALRETTKLVFNLTLQGKPVGSHDETTPCPQGGSARVFGEATSNAVQGASELSLTYEFSACHYLSRDDEPDENYDVVIDGTLTQVGTLAVQPTATTALVMKSDALSIEGTVYDPPKPYSAAACIVELGQSGNDLSGTICGRSAGLKL
ncbi:MAG TPA: hypothetical protein PKA88_27270 [Polyangiaceae bacterium]|nr:hypothetical protein [Polyangiaceae bacterium]